MIENSALGLLNNSLRFIFFAILVFNSTAWSANSSDLGHLTSLAYNKSHSPRIGFEIELTGLSTLHVAQLIHHELGGRLEEREGEFEYYDNDLQRYEIYKKKYFKVKRTALGTIKIVPEDNGMDNSGLSKRSSSITEVITEPLDHNKFQILAALIESLKMKGAIGTQSDIAISIQLNMEMGQGKPDQIEIESILKLTRAYLIEYREGIEEKLNVPAIRQKYLGLFSPEMMSRLSNPNYKPNAHQFYLDFMYRQSLEILGDLKSWSKPIEEVKNSLKEKLESDGFEGVLPVMKWNYLRVSSLMMFLFPDEWMSKFLLDTKWFKPYPIIEFREPNNDFNISELVEFLVGFHHLMEQTYGQVPSNYIELETGILSRDQDRLILAHEKAEGKPYVIRTFIANTESDVDPLENPETQYYFNHSYRRSTPIFLPANGVSKKPIVLPGESVVFHSLPNLGSIVRGKYNPGLENENLAQIFENKYLEYKFWSQYSPEAMAHTILLSDLIEPYEDVKDIIEKMNISFPNGWVMKAVYSSATQASFLINSSMDLVEKYDLFKKNKKEFIAFIEKTKEETKSENPDIFTRTIREKPEFIGWVLHKMIKNPKSGIVQDKLDILAEYRVEVIGGKVLGQHSTIPRYQYDVPKTDSWRDENEIKKIEDFVQSVVDDLPKPLRATPFGMDVAILSNGEFKIIESNPQGNSGFLAYDNRSIKALDKFLLQYPELLNQGEVVKGLSPRNQMQYIRSFLKRINLTEKEVLNGFKKTRSKIQLKELKYPKKDNLPSWRTNTCNLYLN